MPSGALGKRRQDLSWKGGSAELREKNLELGMATIKTGGVEAKMDRDHPRAGSHTHLPEAQRQTQAGQHLGAILVTPHGFLLET